MPLTRIQKFIGKIMLQSKHQKPCCHLQCRANLTTLNYMRKPYCKQIGTRVTTNDFFFRAIANAAKKFPLVAACIDPQDENIQLNNEIGIGFAVSAPQGLVLPVIKNIIDKPLPTIALESGNLLKKARSNKLRPSDFDGANIVFSSLGMYGVNSFFAIVPPKSTAIISVGTLDDTVMPANGNLMVQKIMSIGLAADNRIVNDFYVAQFLQCLVHGIENPKTLTQ